MCLKIFFSGGHSGRVGRVGRLVRLLRVAGVPEGRREVSCGWLLQLSRDAVLASDWLLPRTRSRACDDPPPQGAGADCPCGPGDKCDLDAEACTGGTSGQVGVYLIGFFDFVTPF